MKMRIPGTAGLLLSGIFATAFATPEPTVEAQETGIVMVSESTVLQSGDSWNNTVSVLGRDLLMEYADAAGNTGSLVYLDAGQELILNDDQERSYMRVDQEFIDTFAGNMSGAMGQMQKALEAMPEAQRQMVMQAAGGSMSGMGPSSRREPDVVDTGETVTKHGYATTRHDMVMDGWLARQFWVADWSSVDHGDEMQGAFQGLTSLWASFYETMGDAPFGGASRSLVETLARGIPVVTTEFDVEGTPMIETALQSITEREVDPAAFGPKQGYREQRIEMGGMPGQ